EEPFGQLVQTRGVVASSAFGSRLGELGADREREVDVGRVLAPCELVAERQETIGPRGYRVLVTPELADAEPPAPAIVDERLHRRFSPLRVARPAVLQPARDPVVTVGEDIRLDVDEVADDPLHGKAPAIDLRAHGFDDDAPAAVLDRDHAGSSGCLNTTTPSGGNVIVSEK